jgi:hypothetical protein
MFPISCNAVGDVLTIASIILDIARALNDARGSVAEYRAFVAELETMHTSLNAISRLVQDCTDSALRQTVVREVDLSYQDIEDAFNRIASLSLLGSDEAPPMGSSGLRVNISRQWFKLEWRFLKRGDGQGFQSKLKVSTQRLSTLLVILN